MEPDSTLAIAGDPDRDPVALDAALRDPAGFRDAVLAFVAAIAHAPKPARTARPGSVAAGAGPGYRRAAARYWDARRRLDRDEHPGVDRRAIPVDPILTAGPDGLLLEGFAGDQSAYAALTIGPDAFLASIDPRPGTTSVALGPGLLDRLRRLDPAAPARLVVAPGPAGGPEPPGPPDGWLRGFGRIMGALVLPTLPVSLDRDGLYRLLAAPGFRRRGGSILRFDIEPGRPAVADFGGAPIPLGAPSNAGPGRVRIGDRSRLRALDGLIPRVELADVRLLGDGLPSLWRARLGGGLDFQLALPGWTSGPKSITPALDRLVPPLAPGRYLMSRLAARVGEAPACLVDVPALVAHLAASAAEVYAGLSALAAAGRLAPGLAPGHSRARDAFPAATLARLPIPEDPETIAGRALAAVAPIPIDGDTSTASARTISARVEARPVLLTLHPATGRLIRARCSCSHRSATPCRHARAAWTAALARSPRPTTLDGWLGALMGGGIRS